MATGLGDARVSVRLWDGSSHTVVLQDTLYVPSFRYSLVSESRLDDVGVRIVVEKGKRMYEKEKRKFMVADKKNGLWYVRTCNEKALISSYEERHRVLGHPSTIKDCYDDAQYITPPNNFRCEICDKQKSTHKVPLSKEIGTQKAFEKIHSDLSSQISILTLGKNEYYMTFVDDYTRYCWIYLLKTKNGVETAIKHYWEMVLTQFEIKIKRFHSDNGTEYINQTVSEFFKE